MASRRPGGGPHGTWSLFCLRAAVFLLLLAPVVFFQGGGSPLGRSMRLLQPLTAGQWAQAFGPSSLLPASAVGRVVYSAPLTAPAAAAPAAASGQAAAGPGSLRSSLSSAPAAAAALTLPTRCVVGPHAEHYSYFQGLLTASPPQPFALVRYGDGERLIIQGLPVSKETQAFVEDGWSWDGGGSRLARDMVAGMQGKQGLPFFFGLASPRHDERGLRFFLDSIGKGTPCAQLTFANLWVNANYVFSRALIERLFATQAARIVLLASAEAVEEFKVCAQPGSVFGCVALPGQAVASWEDDSLRLPLLEKAMGFAASSSTPLLFVVSGGPLAKALIPLLFAAHPQHQYVDFGSATDELLKGRRTRSFMGRHANERPEPLDPSWACWDGRCFTALEDADADPRDDAPWRPKLSVAFPPPAALPAAVAVVHSCDTAAPAACRHRPTFWEDVAAGAWEPATFALLRYYLQNGGQYIEVGAGVGPTALFAASLASRVHALEPDQVAFGELASNFALNPRLARRARLYRGCLWAEGGVRAFVGSGEGSKAIAIAGKGGGGFEAHCVHPSELGSLLNIFTAMRQGDGWVELVRVNAGGSESHIVPELIGLLNSLDKPPLLLSFHESRDATRDPKVVEALSAYQFAYTDGGVPVTDRAALCARCTMLFSTALVPPGAFLSSGGGVK